MVLLSFSNDYGNQTEYGNKTGSKYAGCVLLYLNV